MTILNLRPRRFAAVVLFSSLTFLSAAYAQQASSPLSPLLAEMEGRWSVEQTTWDGPGGPGRKGTPAVATRKIPPGGGFIEENMTAAASGPDSFTRTAQINYNVTAKAFEYSTIDSRAPQQMHYRSQAAATTFKGDLALSGGKFVAAEWGGKKNVAFAYRVALSPVTDGRQRLQIFFRPLTGRTAEFLATQYIYRRIQ